MLSPLGTQGVVGNNQNIFEFEAVDDQRQQCLEEQFPAELEAGEEAVETAFVAFPC